MVNSCLTACVEDAVQQSSGIDLDQGPPRACCGAGYLCCGIPATVSQGLDHLAARRLESWALYGLSNDSKSEGDGMKIRERAGKTVVAFLALGMGALLSGCMTAQTIEPASEAQFTARDKKLLANPPYAKADIPEPYLRHIVDYHRKEGPGTVVVDPDARSLYYVLDSG